MDSSILTLSWVSLVFHWDWLSHFLFIAWFVIIRAQAILLSYSSFLLASQGNASEKLFGAKSLVEQFNPVRVFRHLQIKVRHRLLKSKRSSFTLGGLCLTDSVMVSNDLTDVTLVSDDTERGLDWCDSGE